jgi:hypothetical protein
MRKTVVAITMVVVLLAMSTGFAVADQVWDLVCTDNPTGPQGQVFELRYTDPDAGGHTWTTNAYAMLLAAGDGMTYTVDPTITFAIINNMAVLDVTDNADDLDGTFHISGYDIFTPANTIPAPTLIATITTSAPTSIWFEINSALFVVNNNGTNYQGLVMDANGMLAADGVVGPPVSPSPPVPEIITIVLVSLGLISLGGYIWYRRHNMQIAAID